MCAFSTRQLTQQKQYHHLLCKCIFTYVAVLEMIWSMCTTIFIPNSEKPMVSCIKNKKNRRILAKMPSANAFNIVWFGRGPRAQILLHNLAPIDKSIAYNREIISTEDGVDISLDYKEDKAMNDKTPLILCLHGMGSNSKSMLMQAFTNVSLKRRYRSVVYNRRGHGDVSLLFRLDNVKEDVIFPRHVNMKDMILVVNHLVRKYPHAPKYLFGFSCGGNLLITYISKYPGNPFIASVSVSNGYNIYKGACILKKSPICDAMVSQSLKNILYNKFDEVEKIAKKYNIHVDFESVMRCKSFKRLEEMLVGLYGFGSLKEYYDSNSCHTFINKVKTPLLCINNMNDPLVHSSMCDIPLEASMRNKNIISITTKHGSHGGWIENINKDPWYAIIFFEYIEAI